MNTVRILPEPLSNRIAAGEVVERPASVVKELVENSIDAGADDISVEVARSGKSLIRVSDNGSGLSRDDALLSIERYATSKIYSQEDLFSISTMGFRGEALPSIASVSRFTMVTRRAQDETGTRIEMAGGNIRSVTEVGAPVGTMVEVRDLFFNTPARKKFLKSDATEMGHISDGLAGMALGHPRIRFRLFSGNGLQKHFPVSEGEFQRAVHVLGLETQSKLHGIRFDGNGLILGGYCVHPDITRNTASRIFLFVNQRRVYDRGLTAAVFQGYRGRIMKGRFPLAVLFIRIGYDEVDVNVHPAKREIRFSNPRQVYADVVPAVAAALSGPAEILRPAGVGRVVDDDRIATGTRTLEATPSRSGSNPPVRPENKPQTGSDAIEESVPGWLEPETPETPGRPGLFSRSFRKVPDPGDQPTIGRSAAPFPEPAREAPLFDFPAHFRIIGQALGTYILAECEAGIRVIDQHAAHERITYEALRGRVRSAGPAGQLLAVPETVELNHREADALERLMPDLEALGFRVSPFGGTTFLIISVPVLFADREVKPILLDILDKSLSDGSERAGDEWLDDCLILMACHRSVRANARLHPEEMQALIRDLEQCENPHHCPHGRPIAFTLTREELEKRFKRLV